MINNIKKRFPSGSSARNVLTLMTGTIIAQAIAIMPKLTRIYTPEEFGVFSVDMAIIGLLLVFATGPYENAIMLASNDEDAINIVALIVLLDKLFNIVPEAVFKEITNNDKPDAGETEAMLLYKQKLVDKLLIYDKRGKKIAKINGINVIGSLGILLSAKYAGFIPEIKPQINKILKSRIYLS